MALQITKPLDQHIEEVITNIDLLTSDKIYTKYPLTKQINNNSRFQELILSDSTTTKEGLEIQVSYNWIKSIREVGKSAKQAALEADSVFELRKIEQDYKNLLTTL